MAGKIEKPTVGKKYHHSMDSLKAECTLISKLKEAENRAEKEGWIKADDMEKELGLSHD